MDYLNRNRNRDRDDRHRNSYKQHDNRFDNYDDGGGGRGRDYNDHDDRFDDSDDRQRRSRSRSSHHEYNNNNNNNNRKSYSSSNQQQRNRNNDFKRNNNHDHDSLYANVQPSRTIMLRHIPLTLDEQELKTEFNMAMVPYRDVRLVRHRDSGQSRGFGFLEFPSIEESIKWMDYTQGWMNLANHEGRIQLCYSIKEHDNESIAAAGTLGTTDWVCTVCGIKNFKRRDKCFKCSLTREESDRKAADKRELDNTTSEPADTLILQGLDPLTTIEAILEQINTICQYVFPVKNARIPRDNAHTNISSCCAFIQYNSIQDATTVLQIIPTGFELDNKLLSINYSRNSYENAISRFEFQLKSPYPTQKNALDSSYYYQTYTNNNSNQADQANSAAAVAQAALKNMYKKQEILNHITSGLMQQSPPNVTSSSALLTNDKNKISSSPPPPVDKSIDANLKLIANQTKKATQAPDPSTFTYDETSGFYYDFVTGFYYDPHSQYYYNGLIQKYMYWDQASFSYIPVETTTSQTSQIDISNNNNNNNNNNSVAVVVEEKISGEEKDDSSKVVNNEAKPATKTAAQIAKDMERWALTMNKKKDTIKQKPEELKSTTTAVDEGSEVKSSGRKQSSLSPPPLKDSNSQEDQNTTATTPPPTTSTTTEQNDKNDDDLEFDLNSLLDLNKMACLLCKRQFDSIEILNKHIAKSNLHKTNLENLLKEKQALKQTDDKEDEEEASLKVALQYRDRAKERRNKYGAPEPPSSSSSSSRRPSKRSSYSPELKPPSIDLGVKNDTNTNKTTSNGGESVASKLMRKMGWNEGSGIGKNLQGIAAPIEATLRQKGAGLGSTNATSIDPNDSYKDAVRKSARARYDQL